MSIPPWAIAMCPLVGLLAILSIAWWYARRGMGAMHRVASFGNLDKLTALLTTGPDTVDEPDAVGLTPLQYAALWGQVEAAKLLIEHSADVNLAKNWSPLHYAAAGGEETLTAVLLDAGADINIRSKADDSTPLHVATVKKQTAMVRFLIERGADLNMATKSGWNACHFAAHEGDLETMLVLLEAGTDWQAQNADEKNSLQVAMASGHKDIVNLAVKYAEAEQQTD